MMLLKQWEKWNLSMGERLVNEMLATKVLKMKILMMETVPKWRSVQSLRKMLS